MSENSDRVVFFDGHDIVVIGVLPFESDHLVVEFSSRVNSGIRNPQAAEKFQSTSEGFFRKRGIPAIYFFGRVNHWWQTEEVFQAIKVLQDFGLNDKFKNITTYGLSMGGYGALMLSGALKANRVVSVAPQYSINSDVVPFETRWPDDRSRINFFYDDMAQGLIKEGQVIIFYDKFFDFDERHVKMVEAIRPVDKFLVNFSSHTVARGLNDMGVLSSVMEKALTNKITKNEFMDLMRISRRKSPLILHNMADALKKKGHLLYASSIHALSIDVMHQRVEENPDYYQRIELAFANIRVIEGYLRDVVENGVINQDILERCKWIASHFNLIPKYAGWKINLAKAEMAVGNIDNARQLLNQVIRLIKPNELARFVKLYVQVLDAKPDLVDSLRANKIYQEQILADDLVALKFGSILIKLGLQRKALVYLDYRHADFKRWHDRPSLMQQQLLALAQCNPARAYQLLDEAFVGDQDSKLYRKLKKFINNTVAAVPST